MTLPLLKLDENGKPAYVKITSEISVSKPIKGERVQQSKRSVVIGSPQFMDVTNLESNETQTMIVNTVLGNELRGAYDKNGYVGRCFEIKKFKPQDGKRYAIFQIVEIEVAAEPASEAPVLQVFDWVPEEQRQQIESFFAGRSDEVKQRIASSVASRHRGGDDPLKQGYPEYLKSKLWGKIKRRVFKRDGKLCRRCGGRATEVHHRSYYYCVINVDAGNRDIWAESVRGGLRSVGAGW
jgi:5-methylcytosine-specific restriction endonuclease McrA